MRLRDGRSSNARSSQWRAIDQVQEVGAAVVTPLTGNNWTVPFERADRSVSAGERPPDVGWQNASEGFFRALGIPLLSVAGQKAVAREGRSGCLRSPGRH